MQRVEERKREEHVAPEHLLAAGGVARVVLEDRFADRVGDPGLQLLERPVAAPEPLADRERDAGAAALQRRDELRDVDRIVLTN